MALMDVFGRYVEQGLNIKVEDFFNAGIMVMNLKKMREINIVGKLQELLSEHKFVVTQDEDYLNVICKGHVKMIELGWNKCPLDNPDFDDKDLKLIHYKLALKPWKYENIRYEEHFWKYAKRTEYYQMLLDMRNNYKNQEVDDLMLKNLMQTAEDYIVNPNNYKNTLKKKGLI